MPSKRSRQAPRLQGAGMSGPLGAGGYASGERIGSSNARARAATSMNTVCTATEVEAVLDIDAVEVEAVEVEAVDDIDESIEVAIEVEVVLVGESRMDTGSSTTPRVSTDDVQHLRANKARAAAAAEGLELVPSSKNQTGFEGVTLTQGRYYVDGYENGMARHLGCFATPEEAALCYARHLGAERAAAEAAKERGEGLNTTKPLTADEARAAAAAEGLELVPSSKNQTGFKGVTLTNGKYYVAVYENGKGRKLSGSFATPEEAALCYARHLGAERAAAEVTVEGPQPLTADEATEVDERHTSGCGSQRPVKHPAPPGPSSADLRPVDALRSCSPLFKAMHDEQCEQQGSSSLSALSSALRPSTVIWRTSNKRPVAAAFGDLGLLEISASGDWVLPRVVGLSLQGDERTQQQPARQQQLSVQQKKQVLMQQLQPMAPDEQCPLHMLWE